VPTPRLSRLELRVMDAFWERGVSSIREIQESLPAARRPAYTTVQTIVSRLEAKKAIRRVKKVGNAYVFEAVITRQAAQRRLVDELLAFFGGRSQPVVAHLIESGKLTREDLREAEQVFHRLSSQRPASEPSDASPRERRADRGSPASERVGGSAGAKPPGSTKEAKP
jgi:BlaI family transcriptional regulator, penicillinase repressor